MLQKIRNSIFTLAVASIIFAGYLLYSQAINVQINEKELVPYAEVNRKQAKYSTIVRLYLSDGGMCSGVVISDDYVLTASHCAVSKWGIMDAKEVEVYSEDREDTHILGHFVAVQRNKDVALLKGNFKNFVVSKPNFEDIVSVKDFILTSCGFPSDGKLNCVLASYDGPSMWQYKAKSASIFPGMSGGPVFNLDGEVVAVNSALASDCVIFSPLIGLRSEWGI